MIHIHMPMMDKVTKFVKKEKKINKYIIYP